MIWDRKTTQAIERMRAQYSVSTEALTAGGDEYVKSLAGKLCNEIQEMAYTYAAELAIEDFVFSWDVSAIPATSAKVHVLRARWEPATTTVLMVGGDLDGKEFTVERETLRKFPVRVARALDTDKLWGTSGPDPLPTAADPNSVISYEWSGWEDARRIWVYEVSK